MRPVVPSSAAETQEQKTWRGLSEPDLVVRHLEELSLNALPSLENIYLDGWVVRFANGYTKRANSVNPLYDSSMNLDDKIAYCESLYAVRKQPTVYKMTSLAEPHDLDMVLASLGYREEPGASVQVVRLDTIDKPDKGRVTLAADANDQWLSAYFHLNNVQERYMHTMRQMIQRIAPQKCLAAVYIDGRIAAVGLCVLDRGYLGMFDIVTEPALRQKGYGHQLMLYLLNWGKANGAEYAYLQVMLSNSPALYLYKKLGFHEVYRYWYRIKW